MDLQEIGYKSEDHILLFQDTVQWRNLLNMVKVKKVKQSRYTPWKRLGGEEV
jgi:hypothetical protein